MMGSTALALFYTDQENQALRLEQEQRFATESANAVKHAYAAGKVFSILTSHFVSEKKAEKIVTLLGYANEYAERIFKLGNPDTTMEMMKDLYNNQAGIVAAKWYAKHPREVEGLSLHDVIIVLEQRGLLVVMANNDILLAKKDSHLRGETADILGATSWFEAQQPKIAGEVKTTLIDIYAPNTNPVAVYP